MPFYKGKNFIETFYERYDPKTGSRAFWDCKELSTTPTGK